MTRVVDEVREVADRASGRIRLSAEHTVVAIAGATGSGKSSTFNWLTGLDLSAVGVRRPTTSWATACVWGSEGADRAARVARHPSSPPGHPRLDARHPPRGPGASRASCCSTSPTTTRPRSSHHLEVDRLVQLADLLVWVLDPQKYADAAIHDRYLAPYTTHQDVMLVVLNHIDTVPEAERDGMLGRRTPPARRRGPRRRTRARRQRPRGHRHGRAQGRGGRPGLRQEVRDRAGRGRRARGGRPARGGVRHGQVAHPGPQAGGRARGCVRRRRRRADGGRGRGEVDEDPGTAGDRVAGVQGLLDVPQADPLKRLHLELGAAGKHLSGRARTSVPEATQVERARVDAEVRALADDVSEGLSRRGCSRSARRRCPGSTTWAIGSTARWPAPTSESRGSRGGRGWCGCSSGC